ncbi:hypothetical protein [Myxococcus sp. CA040A]|uniref:hypothetical protein n=1 Tax=Myxococcus sp. CA040A TaxID=2741738 RepID=UPI00157B83A5|nr:hypothetical protein [Myxococcus sp. CA040A]NTX07021.1 hypothetical protein [Myxococcus sp. CA040A]
MMLRHTLTKALEMVLARVAAGDPDLSSALRFVARSRRILSNSTETLAAKVSAEMDKLLDDVRYDAPPARLDNPFPHGPLPSEALLHRAWTDACAAARRNMSPPPQGLGLTAWDDVGGLSRLQALGLLTVAIQRLATMPEFGSGPLFPGLRR